MHTEIFAHHDSPEILLLSHGIAMLLAYAVLAPIAVLFARFVKYNVNGRVWFHAHASLVTIVLVTHLSAVVVAYVAVRDIHWNQPHVIAGITTTSLLLLQYPLGISIAFCSRSNAMGTPTLNRLHYAVGRILVPFAVFVTIPLGLARFGALFPTAEAGWVGAVTYAVCVAVGASTFALLEGWRYGAEHLALGDGFHALLEDSEGSEEGEGQVGGGGRGGEEIEVAENSESVPPAVLARASGALENAAKKPALEVRAESTSAAGVVEIPIMVAVKPVVVVPSRTLEGEHTENGSIKIETGKGPAEAESATEPTC
ncbi:hypothetical protein BC830DRAFT_1112231 [Chytriomyces sp. MP71]|nr:hypothetical protein BC830DRAFT_1112231 [Chytriomyces sp. MP71]